MALQLSNLIMDKLNKFKMEELDYLKTDIFNILLFYYSLFNHLLFFPKFLQAPWGQSLPPQS